MTHEHTIKLTGEAASASGLSGHVLKDLFAVLVQGAEQSLRLRIEGRSTARGTQPIWLRHASDFQMIELSRTDGGRTLRLEAPSLLEAMPDKFMQAEIFDDLDPRLSALELFEDALEQAIEEKSDSDAFDQALLRTCVDFRGLLTAGIEAVEIKNGRTVRVDIESVQKVVKLSKLDYSPRRVRLAGRLETIRYSDCRFTLQLDTGTKVNGAAAELGAEALRTYFGKNVVVTGDAEFRPSGRLLRVEADTVELASENDLKTFLTLPRPLLAPPVPDASPKRAGLASLLGQWPGDESIDELTAKLRQLG